MSKRIKYHYDNKLHARFIRNTGQQQPQINSGYVVGYSPDFVLLQETRWFKLSWYHIFPISLLKTIQFNNWNRRYHRIMIWRDAVEVVGINYPIDLTNWESIFETLKKYELNVSVESRNGKTAISSIIKTTPQSVYVQAVDFSKSTEKEVIEIAFESITDILFNKKIRRKKKAQPTKRKVKPT